MCWYFHCSPVTAATEVKLHSSSYLLGLHTLAQMKHLSFMKIFFNALHRDIIFLCDSMTPGTISTWGHFIFTIIYWANVIVVTLLAENHKISFLEETQLCGHWKGIHQHNTRRISEMKYLYFITCKMFDRVESWLFRHALG